MASKRETRGIVLRRKTYWHHHQVNRKRKWTNLKVGTLSEALKEVEKLRDSPVTGRNTPLAREIPRFIAYKLDRDEFTKNSAEKADVVLGMFAQDLPDSTLQDVTTAEVQGWYEAIRKRTTESTAQSYVMVVRSFFRWASDIERVRIDNPVQRIRLARLPKRSRKQFANKKQRDELVKDAPTDDLRFILFCGFFAGMRRDEISEARVGWFDLQQGLTHIQRTDTFRTKDREDRTIPMTKPFRKFLRSYLGKRPPEQFALKPEVKHGKSRYRYDFRRPFMDYVRSKGLGWVTPHVCRHSFASLLASEGVSIYKIAKWLGDDVRVTQDHYAHLLPIDADIHKLG